MGRGLPIEGQGNRGHKKKYKDRIAEARYQTPIEGEKVISLGSMEDLIKVADELGKPVIHQAPDSPEEPHAYWVFDGLSRYEYLLTEETPSIEKDTSTKST